MRITTLLASAALAGALGFHTAAFAGGMWDRKEGGSLKDEPVAVAPPSFEGLYLGLHLGYAVDGNADFDFIAGTQSSTEIDGFVYGGHLGYNWQSGPFVFGLESDISGAELDGTSPCPNAAFNCNADLDLLASIRARLGYVASTGLLIYLTGGYAYAEADFQANDGLGDVYRGSGEFDGYVIGGGLEALLSQNMVLGLEALYYDFDGERIAFENALGARDDFDADLDTTVIRARLSYKFGGLWN